NGSVSVSDSNFIGNVANFGGAISKSQGTSALTGSALIQNSARIAGGALFLGSGTTTSHKNSFARNTSMDGGGAIAQDNGNVLDLESCSITLNSAVSNGGGVLAKDSSCTFSNTIVAANPAGGSADIHNNNSTLSRAGVNLIGSNAGTEESFPDGDPNLNGDIVGTNAAPIDPELSLPGYYGGPTITVHPLAGSPVINGGGTSTLSTDQRGFSRSIGASPDIGAVEAGPALVVNITADEDDGALELGSGNSLRECVESVTTPGSRVVFSAAVNGGTINLSSNYINSDGREVFIDASAMSNGITVDGSAVTGIFTANGNSSATTLALESLTLQNGTGNSAVKISGDARLTIAHCELNGNSSANSGGAVSLSSSLAMVSESSFSENSTSGTGGAAIYAGSYSHLTVDRCSFIENEAISASESRGAGIYCLASGYEISNSVFANNFVSGNLGGKGGAFYFTDALGYLPECYSFTNSTLTNNQALSGGALYFDGVLGIHHLRHLTISGNAADIGAGIHLKRAGNNTDQLIFDHCIIASNFSPIYPDIYYLPQGAAQMLTPGPNLIGDNSSAESFFPAGLLVGTMAAPLAPLLGNLGDYGGPTRTRPLQIGSLAIDAGVESDATPAFDQRGWSRVSGGAPDLGAYENGHLLNYATWAAEKIPLGGDAGFEGDYGNDQQDNGLEYGTGGDPAVSTPGNVLTATRVDKGGGLYEMHLTFPYEPSAPDLRYTLTRNRNLGTFLNRYRFETSTGTQSLHPSGNVTAILDPENKMITVIDDGLAGGGKYFWRLEVELLP
ncbi:hypothetical protein N9A86_04750, partial [Akkermansiaceae bacterium]|nr:hypothetical protein [Akkermansiaceae bacterium]